MAREEGFRADCKHQQTINLSVIFLINKGQPDVIRSSFKQTISNYGRLHTRMKYNKHETKAHYYKAPNLGTRLGPESFILIRKEDIMGDRHHQVVHTE